MKVVILDRDGVINDDSEAFVKSVSEWKPIPGSIEAIARLSRSGYNVYVATNQSGVARGLFTEADLQAIHDRCLELVTAAGGKLGGIHYCPHGPGDGCKCRKPLPGLIRQVINDSGACAADVVIVGDSLRDLQAGVAAGCRRLILVRSGKGDETVAALRRTNNPIMSQIEVCADLAEAAEWIQEKP